MTGPHAAVAATRVAVRRALLAHVQPGERLAVACSGGADSLALAAAVAFEAPRYGCPARGVTVDHGLQAGSPAVAAKAASSMAGLGLDPVEVVPVRVDGGGGPEAAARRARYAALSAVEADWILLGHTLDDQAETVLLGLGRGSGPRSIAGMRPADPPYLRPFLDVRRSDTEAACAAAGLTPWQDPHNADPRYRRVRIRTELMPLLEDVLGGGAAPALARTAALLRADSDALDETAAALAADRKITAPEVPVQAFQGLPEALRRRLVRLWLADVPDLTSTHLAAVDALLTAWTGQGPAALPAGVQVTRRHDHLVQWRSADRSG